jgi:hypothetical protein
MRIRLAVPTAAVHPDVMDAALEAVTRTNEHLIASGVVPTAAEAIRSGVQWRPEPPGDEHFDHALRVVERGWGDCDDLGPYHAASLRVTGEDPAARAVTVRSGPQRWHAVVERGDGTIDDPSAEAGMYEYHAPAQPQLAGPLNQIKLATRLVGEAWCARCDVPWKGSRVSLSGHGLGSTRSDAIIDAIEGPILLGCHVGIVHPVHVGKLGVISGVLSGDDSEMIRERASKRLTKDQFEQALLAARGMT